jgi:hypothetical protein
MSDAALGQKRKCEANAFGERLRAKLLRRKSRPEYSLAVRIAPGHRHEPRLHRSEWLLLRTIGDGLEWSYDWPEPAAQRAALPARLRLQLYIGYIKGIKGYPIALILFCMYNAIFT